MKNYIYRPQRGGLAEAMKEVKEFDTVDELRSHVASHFNDISPDLVNPDDVVIDEESRSDPRIGWGNEHMVLINKCGGTDFIQEYGCGQCVGFVNINTFGGD